MDPVIVLIRYMLPWSLERMSRPELQASSVTPTFFHFKFVANNAGDREQCDIGNPLNIIVVVLIKTQAQCVYVNH